jgi:hypothetical protein
VSADRNNRWLPPSQGMYILIPLARDCQRGVNAWLARLAGASDPPPAVVATSLDNQLPSRLVTYIASDVWPGYSRQRGKRHCP